MNTRNQTIIPASKLRPGTALRVPSNYPGVMHWGIVGHGHDSDGNPMVWHSQKADALRTTPFLEFSGGKSCEILWVPESGRQARAVIQRLESKVGLAWQLTQANCEMVVRWAIEDNPVSHQLGFGVLALLGLAAVFVFAKSK
jgi:hypothetical protein